MSEYTARRVKRRAAFDASVYVNPDMAQRLYDAHYRTRFGYVHYRKTVKDEASDPSHWPEMMSKQELREHVEIGMDVSLVQRIVPESIGGGLDYASGRRFGDAAGWNARELGAPKDICVWCDVESFEHRSPEQILSWCRGWYAGAVKHGIDPNGYFGQGLGNAKDGYLTAEQLYRRLPFWKYWLAASVTPGVYKRGACVQQGTQIGDPSEWGKPGEEKHFGIFPGTPGYPKGLVIDQNMVSLDHLYFEDRKKRGRNRFYVISK
jgi:hypothetical protein